ncbi:hypothetical protein ACMFMG_009128 [Clarireedia jacksonii]
MKYTTAILSSLMASAAVAQPHLRHRHAAKHEKQEKRDVVWVTETEVVTQVVDFTTTVWVPADATSAASSSEAAASPTTLPTAASSSVAAASSSVAAASSSVAAAASSVASSVAAASSSVTEGGAFNESPSSTSVAAPSTSVTPTSTSSVVVPSTTSTSSSVSVAPTTSSTSSSVEIAPPAATSSTSSADALQAAISISVPVVVPTSTSSSSYVAPTTRSVSTGLSADASVSVCSPGSPCTGDITFYTAGLGSCGVTTDGSAVAGVALPWELMGSQSNGNPYCGKTITISYNGKTVIAVVIDKCMGCSGKSIDLTNKAFDALLDEGVGRAQAEWWFN